MIQELLKLILSGRIVQALEQGYDAVIDVFAELADGWLRSFCPAYALAMDGAEAVAPDKMKALRRIALEEVISGLGLRQMILDIIKQWLAAPSTVREAAKLYASAGKDFREVWADPNISSIANLVINRLPDAYALASHVAEDVINGHLQVASTTKWAMGFADTANDAVANILDKWKLGPVADAVREYGGTVNRLTTDAVMIPADAVEQAWSNITSADLDGILSDVIGLPVIRGVVNLAADALTAVATTAVHPTGDSTADAFLTGGLSLIF